MPTVCYKTLTLLSQINIGAKLYLKNGSKVDLKLRSQGAVSTAMSPNTLAHPFGQDYHPMKILILQY